MRGVVLSCHVIISLFDIYSDAKSWFMWVAEFSAFPHYAFPDPRTWTGCAGWHRTSLAWRGVTGHHGKGSDMVMSAYPRCDACIIICTRTYIYICILAETALQMREYPHFKCGNTRISNAGISAFHACGVTVSHL